MRARVDLREGMGDQAVLIDHIRDPAWEPGVTGPIGFAEDVIGIAEEGVGKVVVLGKGFVGLNRIKTGAENLHIMLRKRVVEVAEPAPFGGSTPGAGFGIKPQHDFFAAQFREAYGGAIMGRDGELRCG